MSDYYILEDHKVVLVNDVLIWGKFFQDSERHVARDTIDGNLISTVFLGLDHGLNPQRPLIFETMVFGPNNGAAESYCERCSTWDEALEQHATACAWVRVGKPE